MKLQRARGVRDFLPEEKILREEVIAKLKNVFERYGFSPIETPIIERYDILAAKFGASKESDIMREIFTFKDQGDRKLGLRYEFTFALARLIGMNPQLKMPFKRYQIGRVFRDGPVKLGRAREFWQCDVDIVGVKDLSADAEIIATVRDVFKELNLRVVIQINNRKLLKDILNFVSVKKGKQDSVIISLDKLEKFGRGEVVKELKSKNISSEKINKILQIITYKDLNKIKKKIGSSEGVKELEELCSLLRLYNVEYEFKPSLARGLAYYTGPIYEVYLKDSKIKVSVAGGGRWDDLIGSYTNGKGYAATGVSFGLESIMEEVKKRTKELKKTKTLVYVIPIKTVKESLKIVQKLRNAGIKVDMDLMDRGISKNLNYANRYGIPFVVFVGSKELKKKKVKLRDMKSGRESLLGLNNLIKKLKKEFI